MSYNHPLWAQQDLPAARKVMERLAPTAAARAAKAPAGKERELIESIEVLFGAGDKLARDIAYADALKAMHAKYPADDEIAMLLFAGAARHGTARRRRTCATRCRRRRSPRASSSATRSIPARRTTSSTRSTIPITRSSACTAARDYSKIAPSAAHALHMPSHIFVQLGMWDDVIASNIVAYKAAVDLADAKNLPRGREDFHTLSWLQYAYLQEGKFDEAQKCVDQAKAVADKDTAGEHPRRLRGDESAPGGREREVGEAGAARRRGEGRRRARLRRQRGLPGRRRPERGASWATCRPPTWRSRS